MLAVIRSSSLIHVCRYVTTSLKRLSTSLRQSLRLSCVHGVFFSLMIDHWSVLSDAGYWSMVSWSDAGYSSIVSWSDAGYWSIVSWSHVCQDLYTVMSFVSFRPFRHFVIPSKYISKITSY